VEGSCEYIYVEVVGCRQEGALIFGGEVRQVAKQHHKFKLFLVTNTLQSTREWIYLRVVDE